MTERVLGLDDPGCLDPARAGAKASRLARARAAGLPVLPGVVVTASAGQAALSAGAEALARGGSGRARLAVLEVTPDAALWDELESRLPPASAYIVRSSSPLETGGVWAGAFSTFGDVTIDELRTAVRGVWASVFTVAAVERMSAAGVAPESVDMAVLIQPFVRPSVGGTATVHADDAVEVVVTDEPLEQLMSGWARATRVTVRDGGRPASPEAELTGVAEAAELATEVRDRLGDDQVEWGLLDAEPVLLQTARAAARGETADSEAEVVADLPPGALHLALVAAAWPGVLATELVLPWAVAVEGDLGWTGGSGEPSLDPAADLADAVKRSADLVGAAWGDRWASAPAHLRAAASGDPVALELIGTLSPVSPEAGREVLDLLAAVAVAVDRLGLVAHARQVWAYTCRALQRALAEGTALAPVLRRPVDPWEPLLDAAVTASSPALRGEPAAPGRGAGRVLFVDDVQHAARPDGRFVVVAERPLPSLAPLLWGAAGLVTTAGAAGAHLVEVARSLGVPAVVGVDLASQGWTPARLTPATAVAAVDGSAGTVSLQSVSFGDYQNTQNSHGRDIMP